MRENKSIFQNIDWLLVLLYIVLVLIGWANIYAAVFNEENSSILDSTQKYGKQLIWIGTSAVLILLILFIDGKVFQALAYPIYFISILSLLGLFVFGKEIAGATSWYAFGGFSIQPSEFAKFATALALARFVGSEGVSLKRWKNRAIGLAIILLPALIIIPQPDPGSALVYFALILVLYREGLSGNYIFLGISLIVLFIMSLLMNSLYIILGLIVVGILVYFLTRHIRKFFWKIILALMVFISFIQIVDYAFENILEDRHRNRINILLGKAHDPKGIGYNTEQSKIAIGSGGLEGKGFLKGTQTKYDFVPEQSTDFIFCTVGEEWGFMGSTVLILLFVLLFFRLIKVAERQKTAFTRVYGYSVVAIFFFHFTINIAMTIGLAPVIGIPLPFFSYGGSSLWGFTILLFIFIKLDAYRHQIL